MPDAIIMPNGWHAAVPVFSATRNVVDLVCLVLLPLRCAPWIAVVILFEAPSISAHQASDLQQQVQWAGEPERS
jgi:hypothetical protein